VASKHTATDEKLDTLSQEVTNEHVLSTYGDYIPSPNSLDFER
jgi:hypothetical protein